MEKICFRENIKGFTVKENHKKVSSSKIQLVTSTMGASRKLQSFKGKLADSAVGEFPQKTQMNFRSP